MNPSHFPGAHSDRLDATQIVSIATSLAFKHKFWLLRTFSCLWKNSVQKQHSQKILEFQVQFSFSLFPLCTLWHTKNYYWDAAILHSCCRKCFCQEIVLRLCIPNRHSKREHDFFFFVKGKIWIIFCSTQKCSLVHCLSSWSGLLA